MKRICALAAALVAAFSLHAKDYKLVSPGGEVSVLVQSGDKLLWSVSAGSETLLAPSEISLTLQDGTIYGAGTQFRKAVKRVSPRPFPRKTSSGVLSGTSTMN